MHGLQWRPLQAVDQDRQRDARLNAHYAAQWLARAARAYIPPQPDHGHTNLGWDDALGGFTTHPLPDGARLGLKIAGLTLVVLDGAGKDQAFALVGRRDAEVREWLGDLLGANGLDPQALDAPSPYEMPPHPIADGAAYGAGLGEALRVLAAWYGNANLLLGDAPLRLVDRQIAAPPVRCWPH